MPQPSAARLHEFEVVSNERVAGGLFRLVFRAPDLASSLEAGQFVNIHVPGDPSQIVRIPVSFSGTNPADGTVETVYAVVGDGTRRMSLMRPGDTTNVLGPCGHGWRVREVGDRALIVAGGVGITPIVGLGRALSTSGIAFDAVVGSQTSSKLWGVNELVVAGAGEVFVTTDDGTRGLRGFTTDGMVELMSRNEYSCVLTCGPEPMMAGVARLCHERGVACQVSMERMMTCGFGACSTCNVAMRRGGYASTCMDGPVFDAEEVAW